MEQKTIEKMFGTWSLLSQTQAKRDGTLETETASNLPAGSYTFFVNPPDGATSTLRLYRGSEEIKMVDRPQMTFVLADGETLRVSINHIFNRVGTVAVESDPVGMSFTMIGPNGQQYKDITPKAYVNVPEGQYSVQYEPLDGCVSPPRKSLYLEKSRRASFTVKIICDEATKIREEKAPENDQFVTVTVDGDELAFDDVPQEAWFAPYVFNVARKGVLAGYKNSRGELTGIFGPGNNVTIAELAKIAHRVAGIDETEIKDSSLNPWAGDEWYSPFLASAEQRGWTIFTDATVDPSRDATRGEVLVTLLQVLDVPMNWQKGDAFKDVNERTPFAAAIETAAEFEIVSGTQTATGEDTGLFGPTSAINRAEIAKMVDKAIETFLTDEGSSSKSSTK